MLLAGYVAFLIYGHLTATVDPVDFRLLAPVFTAGLILVAGVLRAPRAIPVAAAVLAVFLAANLVSLYLHRRHATGDPVRADRVGRRDPTEKRIAFAAFFDQDTPALVPREVQRAGIRLELLRRFPDGTLWAVG